MTETYIYTADGWRSLDTGLPLDTSRNVPGWGTPSFEDTFEGTALDTSKWRINDRSTFGNLSYDWGNIQAGQVEVSGGLLHMKVTQRAAPFIGGDGRERWWDTPYIDTRVAGLHSALYGRWEIRCQNNTPVGTSRGIWPAFWLRNGSTGEVDVMEEWGSPSDRTDYRKGYSQSTFHESTNGGMRKAGFWLESEANKADGKVRGPNADGFRTFTFERTPEYAAFYHDGTLAVKITPASHPWVWGPTFDSPFHMRLQVQMGDAYWTKAPVPGPLTMADSALLVDYVRFWDYKAGGEA